MLSKYMYVLIIEIVEIFTDDVIKKLMQELWQ